MEGQGGREAREDERPRKMGDGRPGGRGWPERMGGQGEWEAKKSGRPPALRRLLGSVKAALYGHVPR
ncbi:hypothetical protein Hamer_G000885 [Homarus americanus]|uniref:Uncharacterized protein n=1 Tax=Homarus americanus TaxID=6706 RepID=A0A8J5N292_HOMAM|nr:hypothetical protein Hamer_G000885 [Homarus americanus]